ncbi:MAG: cob(I)yrinic acid a,c-diamide adenosyltransferase [Candidatus Omnitrophica bacterium CG23_combo_of_CG06-09_8_20_14_all_41_10]|uniref:corrinoid adenosyltransferase n=1 Tax=Candidatus Sherwoodlollariibacterium unditelluris TaxID=1974757 RepID=A0A2G9YI65_9BACT|nr:MAG: cob(I)yrinic acid a,c-diamide adenosyltransferase [Candidatus Omnitrophica bacterium CG23_combo_of_CG06-09_8_20_14_all_41_10]
MIQVYTGNGKGKTTAALGLAIRAAGAGLNVYIGQFAKGRIYGFGQRRPNHRSPTYSELAALKKIKNIKVEQFGRHCFIKAKPDKQDIRLACAGLEKIKRAVLSRKYRLIILDEINIALKFKLISLEEVLAILKKAPVNTEIVLTGRYACPEILKVADLVSEIKEKKHYYNKGVKARRGIEF